jgi:hypothetical protein
MISCHPSSDSEEEVLRGMLARAGVQLGAGDEPPTLAESTGECRSCLHVDLTAALLCA